jgi:molybdenum cofactor cytidylyltransferase
VNCQFHEKGEVERLTASKRVAGVVLASGMSTRFGGRNKLLAPVDGEPVIRRTIKAYLEAGLDPVLVVVGYEGQLVAEALTGLRVVAIYNPDFAEGQSRALRRGVQSLPAGVNAAVIGVGDQPFLTPQVIGRVVARYVESGAPVVAPRYAGRRGNPVLFDRALFPELLEVTGDVGGRPVLQHHRDDIAWVDVDEQRVGLDIDTDDEYRGLQAEQ